MDSLKGNKGITRDLSIPLIHDSFKAYKSIEAFNKTSKSNNDKTLELLKNINELVSSYTEVKSIYETKTAEIKTIIDMESITI